MLKIKYIWALSIVLIFASCEDGKYESEIEPPIEVISGSADFTNYVAIGNSLTAGIADASLFIAGQTNAYPNLVAEKMSLAGGGEFTQPLMNDNVGGFLFNGNQMPFPYTKRLVFNAPDLVPHPGTPTTELTNIQPGPYNNMGVAGARSYHLLANGYGNMAGVPLGLANPYFARMASSPNASVLEDAMAASPTFFSLWIGSNDVLGYATSGGDGSSEITAKPLFDGAMTALIGTLASSGAQGVVGNIPNVLHGAYFNAVPHDALDPTDPVYGPQIPLLNASYAQLNQAYAYLGVPERSVVFSETEASPIVIHDESIPNIAAQLTAVLMGGGLDQGTATVLGNQYGQSRQANESDMILLPSMTVIGTLNEAYFAQLVGMNVPPELAGQLSINGITYPMPDTYVLLTSEQNEITLATAMFNQTIAQLVSTSGLAFFDAKALMDEVAETGYSSNGFNVNTDLIFGGLFSLDGIHLTARGNAIVANEMMKVIDAEFGSNFEVAGALYDLGDFPVFYSASLP